MDTSQLRKDQRRSPLQFGRSDWLALWIVLWVVGALWVATCVVIPVVDWAQGRPLTIWLISAAGNIPEPALDAARATEVTWAEFAVSVSDPTATERLWNLLAGVVSAAVVVAGLWLAGRVMKAIGQGPVFTRGLVRTLRILAVYVTCSSIVLPLSSAVAQWLLARGLDASQSVFFYYEIDPMWLLAGGFLGVLAEGFNRALQLQDDVDGLV